MIILGGPRAVTGGGEKSEGASSLELFLACSEFSPPPIHVTAPGSPRMDHDLLCLKLMNYY